MQNMSKLELSIQLTKIGLGLIAIGLLIKIATNLGLWN